MFQGLSLEQAPPYKIPLRFYITGGVYLVMLGVLSLLYAPSLESRYSYEAIALTHTLTIGFFSHVMFGSMFQIIPVMLGIAYKNVVRNANIIYAMLNVGIVFFLIGFLTHTLAMLHIGGSVLLGGFLYFGYLSFSTVFESVEKDFLVQNFAASFALLFLGSIFGFIALLGHSGFVSSIKFGAIHIALMLFGWVFILVNAVSYKIIPMFFVAKEFPEILKRWLYVAVIVFLFGLIYFRLGDDYVATHIMLVLLSGCVILFATMSIWILKNRKRARRDLSVDLWYFAMANIIAAACLIPVDNFFEKDLSLFIAFFGLFGGIYALINAMLYKIVPFLTWFHLSSSMVFEAEMSQVIPKDAMQKQVYLYFFSYGAFVVSFFWTFALILGSILFIASSLLLLRNIIQAQRYYNEYIKKKVDMADFAPSV